VPWCLRGKAKKEDRRYVVKFSEKNVLLCEVHKNGISGNIRIQTNTNTTEYSYK